MNRSSACGAYYKPEGETNAQSYTSKETVELDRLTRHFRGDEGGLIGLHAIDPETNTSQWVAVDIDAHSDADDPEVNLRAAMAWWESANAITSSARLIDSNGAGGYHLWIPFGEAIPSEHVYSFGLWLTRDYEAFGFTKPPETFPKQPRLDKRRPYGNWLRLPGRHHTRDHWSRVWDGSKWASGHKAIDLLVRSGGAPFVLPAEAKGYERPRTKLVSVPVAFTVDLADSEKARRAAAYLDKMPGAIAGQRGHDATFRVACVLVHGFDLNEGDAWALLCDWNQRCEPPWSEHDLRHKLEDAFATPDDRGRGYLLARFEDATRIEREHEPKGEADLSTWRDDLKRSRIAAVDEPGVYADVGPTGSGKSTADFAAMERVDSGLFVVPSHANCREVFRDSLAHGLMAWPYAKRSTKSIEEPCMLCRGADGGCLVCGFEGHHTTPANCWNPEADAADRGNINALEAVCRHCPHRERCKEEGYLYDVKETAAESHRVATHARAATRGLDRLANGAKVVSLHEDATNVLRPNASIPEHELRVFRQVIERCFTDPKFLNRIQSDSDISEWLAHAADELDAVIDIVTNATESAQLEVPQRQHKPWALANILLEAVGAEGARVPHVTAMIGSLSGEWSHAAVMVEVVRESKDRFRYDRSLSVCRQNPLPKDAAILLGDSTADIEAVRSMTGRDVFDFTPKGRLPHQARGVQWARDVTMRTSPAVVRSIVRGVLAQFPERRRVGLICRRKHLAAIEELDELFRSRLSKLSYFGSGEDRASNAWHKECDLLIVLGTPRVDKSAIRHRLFVTRNDDAFATDSAWGDIVREMPTEDGGLTDVVGLGFIDPDWRRAAEGMVQANLRQAIGRARLVTDQAIPCVAVTTEDSGLPVVGSEWEVIPDEAEALLTGMSPISIGIEPVPVKSPELARSSGKDPSTIRHHLRSLESAGLVIRHGQRGGWSLAPPWVAA